MPTLHVASVPAFLSRRDADCSVAFDLVEAFRGRASRRKRRAWRQRDVKTAVVGAGVGSTAAEGDVADIAIVSTQRVTGVFTKARCGNVAYQAFERAKRVAGFQPVFAGIDYVSYLTFLSSQRVTCVVAHTRFGDVTDFATKVV